MKVVATEKGFDGICERVPGEVFEWPHSYSCAWAKPVDSKEEVSEQTHDESKSEEKKHKKRKNDQEIG